MLPLQLFLLATSSVVVAMYDYGFSNRVLMARQVGEITTKGAPAITNEPVPLRSEIRALENYTEAWTLYILALDWMQFEDQTNDLSWYEIAGIHGRPYKAWNGVASTSNNDSGYCAHVSTLFPTWHRPYLALYEQTVYDLVNLIASLYTPGPIQNRYTTAARRFRIPYWDWAQLPTDGPIFPYSIGGSPGMSVDGPAGTQIIANPLYSYYFENSITADLPEAPLVYWNKTLRYPTTQNSSAMSQDAGIRSLFISNQPSLRSRLYSIMTDRLYSNYSLWSTEEWTVDHPTGAYDSIESIHDEVHGISGAGGHMTYIEYSSFDPVFFLHHANVDRLFAMWQILNPDSFVEPTKAVYTTFNSLAGQIQDSETILTPFRDNSSSGFWTSSTARDIEVFNYQYPETQNPNSTSLSDMQARIRQSINVLYGPISNLTVLSPRQPEPGTAACRAWTVNILAKKNFFGCPFTVEVMVSDNIIGSHFVNAPLQVYSSDVTISASIPLANVPIVGSLSYRLVLANGTILAKSTSGVTISLISHEVTPQVDISEFPVYSDYTEHGIIPGIAQ